MRIRRSVLYVLLLAGCSSDGSSPVSPTPQPLGPPEVADVAGTWTATISASTEDVVGGGCPGDVARRLRISTTRTATIVVEQHGGSLAGSSVKIEGVTCRFSGSVTGNTVQAAVGACAPDTISIGVVSGCGSEPWRLESLALTMEATVSGPVITGNPKATAMAVGPDGSHPVTATGQLSMRR